MPQDYNRNQHASSGRVFEGHGSDHLSSGRQGSSQRFAPQTAGQYGGSRAPRSTNQQNATRNGARYASSNQRSSEYSRSNTRYGSRTTQPQRNPNKRNARNERENKEYAAYTGKPPQHNTSRRALIIALIVIAVIAVLGLVMFVRGLPINVTVNGTELELGGGKNINTLVAEGHAKPTPGDLVSVDGDVLEQGEGERMWASVNDEYTADYEAKLPNKAVIAINNGNNITEPSEDKTVEVPYEMREAGTGPITVLETEGKNGTNTIKTGSISKETVEEETDPKEDRVFRKYAPDVGFEKVVAFTFDDGPWPGTTKEILDTLKEFEVKATFFVLGTRVEADNGTELVKRAYEDGHQIATHSYSHARGSGKGVDLGKMSDKEQIEEITKGYESIERALGVPPSRVLRTPGGNYSLKTMDTLAPYVDAEIGWNIDTRDWQQPGVDVIVEEMMSVKPGSIVLCHDGGGSRGQTVEALKKALPQLKGQGYRFITIDELLEYPKKEVTA